MGCEWSIRAAGGGGGATGTSYCCGEDARRLSGRWRLCCAAGCEVGGLCSRQRPDHRVTRQAGG